MVQGTDLFLYQKNWKSKYNTYNMAEAETHFSRVLVEVQGIVYKETETIVRALIPTWKADQVVKFPMLELKNWDLIEHLQSGDRLLAEVNLEAKTPEELKISNFEMAPPPISDLTVL